LLKEYTVLLDPPTFTHSAAAPVAAPSRQQTDVASAGRIQRDTAAANQPSQPRPVTSPSGTGRSRVNSSDNTYGRTAPSDTMWAIASQTLPSNGVTPAQNMLAIQRLNPGAFINDNVNLLKRGVVLRLPSESEASALSAAEASAEVRQQTEAWRSGAPARAAAAASDRAQQSAAAQQSATIDATARGPGNAGSAEAAANEGRLRIVATEETGSVNAIENAGASDEATASVGDPAAQERLAELNRQVDELTYQLDLQKRGVAEQLSERDSTINLKDQQIAQLEAQLKALRESARNVAAAERSTQQAPAEDATPWWQQSYVLAGALGLLALLVAGVFSRRRRSTEDLALDDLTADEPSFELGESAFAEATPLGDAELLGDLEEADAAMDVDPAIDQVEEVSASIDADDELSDEELFGPADDAAPETPASGDPAQTSDVIGEADIYIAYGRYPQAIALLQGAVEANPNDHAVRMRLLEVAAETKDADSYATQVVAMREHCDDADTLNAVDRLHDSLDSDFRNQVEALGGNGNGATASTTVTDETAAPSSDSDDGDLLSSTGVAAGAAGAALAAGAASVFGQSDDADSNDSAAESEFLLEDDVSSTDSSSDIDEPFAFDTTVSQLEADSVAEEAVIDDSLEDLAADLPESDELDGEFELELDTAGAVDDDLDSLTDELADVAAADLDQPAVDTDQFSTNVVDAASVEETGAEDFTLDLDIDESSTREFADIEADVDSLGGDLGLDFPDDADELERVVAETDDDQLLDEIERSLDELETDGLLSPELSDDGDFSFDDDADTSATKLDLARAYIDMGDDDGAREILGEVITEGDTNQKGEANELLDKL